MKDGAMLWSGMALIGHLRARVAGGTPASVGGVSIDTRTLEPGDLFFAIAGETHDGHAFVRKAFEAGAAAAVVDEAHAGALEGAGPLYVVKDVLQALNDLAAAARARSGAGIVAVTGSAGKTSTKEALRVALSKSGVTHASAASYNNHWGVPLSLARMPVEARFGVFEIGMNHAGEITPLVGLARPHVAIVTTVAAVHLAAFRSVDEIADAKGEIFSGLEPEGVAIVNRDIEQYERLRAHASRSRAGEIMTFGESENADARLLGLAEIDGGAIVDASILGAALRYRIGAQGKHMAINSLAVLLAARELGQDMREAARALSAFTPPSGRGSRSDLSIGEGKAVLIDESYNANPASMRAALALLGSIRVYGKGRRIAVLGDMLELGDQEQALHAGLADAIAANRVDLVFAAGPLMKSLYDAIAPERRALWAPSSSDLADGLLECVRAGDAVMIKGSNGSRMAPLVAMLNDRYAKVAGREDRKG